MIDINILVQSNSFPINLSWEINPENGINYTFIGDTILGKAKDLESLSGQVSFDKLNNSKIQLLAKVDYTNSKSLLPTEYILYQNYPNPFNPSTKIKFALPKESQVNLSVFSIIGEKVKELKDEWMKPGYHEVSFDSSTLASGIYIYQLIADDFIISKKMILLK